MATLAAWFLDEGRYLKTTSELFQFGFTFMRYAENQSTSRPEVSPVLDYARNI